MMNEGDIQVAMCTQFKLECIPTSDGPVAKIESGEVRNPPIVDLLAPKCGLFEPHLPQPSYKNPIFGLFVGKSGPFSRFGGYVAPRTPLATGLPTGNDHSTHFDRLTV